MRFRRYAHNTTPLKIVIKKPGKAGSIQKHSRLIFLFVNLDNLHRPFLLALCFKQVARE
jgi:hypothetical protein